MIVGADICTKKKSDINVSLHVQSEVIRAWKCPFAEPALERPISGMFAIMTRQFVGTCEFPAAAFPRTLVRFFASVRPQMRFQVRRFGVRFRTSGVRTSVDNDAPFTPSAPPSRPRHCRISRTSGRSGRSGARIAHGWRVVARKVRRWWRSQGFISRWSRRRHRRCRCCCWSRVCSNNSLLEIVFLVMALLM